MNNVSVFAAYLGTSARQAGPHYGLYHSKHDGKIQSFPSPAFLTVTFLRK